MLCPICKVNLAVTERQGIEIDYCPQCRGVWLDRGELDKLIERAGVNSAFAAAPTYTQPPTYQPLPPQPGYGYGYDRDDDDDHYRYPGNPAYNGQPKPYSKKRKGFLGDLFDFD